MYVQARSALTPKRVPTRCTTGWDRTALCSSWAEFGCDREAIFSLRSAPTGIQCSLLPQGPRNLPTKPRVTRRSMSTVTVRPEVRVKPVIPAPGRRFDHRFFSSMALLMLATVFLGFARTYYLVGIFRAPLPSLIIHLH